MKASLAILLFPIAVLAQGLAERAHPRVDHLEPVGPDIDDYSIAWRTALVHPELGVIRMVILPSFAPEMAVAVQSSTETNLLVDPFAPLLQPPVTNYVVTLRVASTSIWSTFHNPPEEKKHHPFSVSEAQALLDAPTGRKCFVAWDRMLRRTRYRDSDWLGCDGYTVEFQHHMRYGKVWSPPPGLCLDFVGIGYALIRLCQADEVDRGKITGDLNTRLDAFIEALERTDPALQPTPPNAADAPGRHQQTGP